VVIVATIIVFQLHMILGSVETFQSLSQRFVKRGAFGQYGMHIFYFRELAK